MNVVKYEPYSMHDYKSFIHDLHFVPKFKTEENKDIYKIILKAWNFDGFICEEIRCPLDNYSEFRTKENFISYQDACDNYIAKRTGKPYGKEKS